jgi:hypothetical protein
MGIERYFGFHFAETCIYIAEAYVGRDNHLHWEVMEQANYELEPEWLPLFKDAIPNLYDNEGQVYGFSALPAIQRDSPSSSDRFLRFSQHFFKKANIGKVSDAERCKLANLFQYCQVYHIRPQSDETLLATVVVEQLNDRERQDVKTLLEQVVSKAGLKLIGVIRPEEACLCYLWYPSVYQQLKIKSKMILLIHLGYACTSMILLDHGQLIDQSVPIPGMLHIDQGVAMYLRQMGLEKTNDEEELLLYAQRTRRAFVSDQPVVKILDVELRGSVYRAIINGQAFDITNPLKSLLSGLTKWAEPVGEVLLVGEGAHFSPLREALQKACGDIIIHVLPQPTHAAAIGAASRSWQARTERQR